MASLYHPFLNELGTMKDVNNKFWYEVGSLATSAYNCFLPANVGTVSGRPNGEFYNKVYINQSRDLRLKAYEEDDTTLLRNKASENESGRLNGVEALTLFDGTKSSHCFKKITHTDVLGYVNLNEYAKSTALLYDLSTSDEGDDYTLDGILTTFKLSKKYDSVLKVLKSTDGGATWTALALTTNYTVSYTANTITFLVAPLATDLILIQTQAKTNSTKSLPIGTTEATLDKVYASNSHSIYKGGTAVASGTGKIPTGNGSNGFESWYLGDCESVLGKDEINVGTIINAHVGDVYLIVGDGGLIDTASFGKLYKRINSDLLAYTVVTTTGFSASSNWEEVYETAQNHIGSTPSHQTITLDNSDSIASKRFYTLEVDSNNQKQLVLNTKEVAYNSLTTSYDGDNELFDQLTDGTITDDNAKTCITSRTAIKLNSFKGE